MSAIKMPRAARCPSGDLIESLDLQSELNVSWERRYVRFVEIKIKDGIKIVSSCAEAIIFAFCRRQFINHSARALTSSAITSYIAYIYFQSFLTLSQEMEINDFSRVSNCAAAHWAFLRAICMHSGAATNCGQLIHMHTDDNRLWRIFTASALHPHCIASLLIEPLTFGWQHLQVSSLPSLSRYAKSFGIKCGKQADRHIWSSRQREPQQHMHVDKDITLIAICEQQQQQQLKRTHSCCASSLPDGLTTTRANAKEQTADEQQHWPQHWHK